MLIKAEPIIDAVESIIKENNIGKSDFKIITLKITDYTDSMYCKVFCRGEEEFNERKKALKDKKWYIIRGYTKNDKFYKFQQTC